MKKKTVGCFNQRTGWRTGLQLFPVRNIYLGVRHVILLSRLCGWLNYLKKIFRCSPRFLLNECVINCRWKKTIDEKWFIVIINKFIFDSRVSFTSSDAKYTRNLPNYRFMKYQNINRIKRSVRCVRNTSRGRVEDQYWKYHQKWQSVFSEITGS